MKNTKERRLAYRIKKLILLMEEYEIDLDEFQEQDAEVLLNFAQEFKNELEYLEYFKQSKNTQNIPQQNIEEKISNDSSSKKIENPNLKSIHREIVKKLHPDVAGAEKEEEFKQFQKHWEEGNTQEILNVAIKENVIEILEPSCIEELEKSMNDQKKNLTSQKRNLRWGWHQSNKDQFARDRVRKVLGINPEDFQAWLDADKKNKLFKEEEIKKMPMNSRLICLDTPE